jgi:hypothetical protein
LQWALAVGLEDVAANLHNIADLGLRDLLFRPRTRSAVELATWVTRRSTVITWLSSTAPMNMADMMGTIIANSMAATPASLPPACVEGGVNAPC